MGTAWPSYAFGYRAQMIERGLPATTINRRLAALRSLVKLANTLGLVSWTFSAQSVENVPVPPSRDTRGPDRDGFRAMLDAAGAQPGPKGLRDVVLLRLRLRARSAVRQFRPGRQGPSSDRHRGLPHRRPARRQSWSFGPAAGAASSRDHYRTR